MPDREYVYTVYGFSHGELVPIAQYIHELAEKYPGDKYKARGQLLGKKDPFPGSTAYMSADGIRALAAEVKYLRRKTYYGFKYASHVFILTPDGKIV